MESMRIGCSFLRTKRIITQRKLSRLVVLQLVLVVQFVILFQAGLTFTKQCVLRELQTQEHRWMKQFLESCRSERLLRLLRQVIHPTETKLDFPQVRSQKFIIQVTLQNTWKWEPLLVLPLPKTLCAKCHKRVM